MYYPQPMAMAAGLAGGLAVAVGSALGGVARFWVAALVNRRLGEAFPWGTLVVNASGALLAGLLAAALAATGGLPTLEGLLLIGFCGSYTTVSSFALQTFTLAQAGGWPRAIGNILATLALTLFGAWLGLQAGALIPPEGGV
ncbi:MAG: fluoride efflux transporter FluC [Halorhodospira sp.]